MLSDPTANSSENLLTSATGGVTLGYDPAMRLQQVTGAATTRLAYDGLDTVAEYDGSNALQRRYVFGPSMDEPIVQYEGSGTTDRRFMGADERRSIISLTDSSGTLLNINRYDEYGKPQATNMGRFQYTGQKWIGEAGLYHYKARDYLPHLGIFAQTDPIGYAGGVNLYAYVGNDPVNLVDPLGLCIATWDDIYKGYLDGSLEWVGSENFQLDCPIPAAGGANTAPEGGISGGAAGDSNGAEPPETAQLTQCAQSFARRELARRGFPTHHLPSIRFVRSMTGQGPVVSMARWNGNPAIVRGSTVYVDPNSWVRLNTVGDDLVWSEVVHTAQHAFSGSLDTNWFFGAIGSSLMWIDGMDTPHLGWSNNSIEQPAHRIGAEMAAAWKDEGRTCQ